MPCIRLAWRSFQAVMGRSASSSTWASVAWRVAASESVRAFRSASILRGMGQTRRNGTFAVTLAWCGGLIRYNPSGNGGDSVSFETSLVVEQGLWYVIVRRPYIGSVWTGRACIVRSKGFGCVRCGQELS